MVSGDRGSQAACRPAGRRPTAGRAWRNRGLAVLSLLVVLTAGDRAGPVAPVAGSEFTSSARSSSGLTFPDTPAGRRAAWLIGLLSTGERVTEEQIADAFAPSLRRDVPTAELLASLRRLVAGGRWRPVMVEPGGGQGRSLVVVRDPTGRRMRISVDVEPVPPWRVTSVLVQPAQPASVERSDRPMAELMSGLTARGRRAGVLVADAARGCRAVFAHRAGEPLPVASIAKLYILGAVALRVRSGAARWENTLRVEDRWKSIPSGLLREVDAGVALTLREFAERLIVQSDNTAADHLQAFVGRRAVEDAQRVMGHHAPRRNTPFLSTMEMARLVGVPDGSREARWTATPADVCRAHVWLQEMSEGDPVLRRLLGESRGEVADARAWPYVTYKGGTGLRTVAKSWYLERADGRRFVVVAVATGVADGGAGVAAAGHAAIARLAAATATP